MKELRRLAGALAATLAVSLYSATPAFPQATNGEITGRVLDAAGAAVPGATIVARNESTGLLSFAVCLRLFNMDS